MHLTEEQESIIRSTGSIKINAVAGSGKTTTLIEYARTRPSGSKILYLAFNKSVKLEAITKFREKGLFNVDIETAHSLALRNLKGSQLKIRDSDYKAYEISEILGLSGPSDKYLIYMFANHLSKFADYFFNSDKENIKELNYVDVALTNDAKEFARNNYPNLEKYTKVFIEKMESGEIDVSHNFYLKKFQLSKPKLSYDYILFDEAQDASPAMLDVVLKQKAVKILVGDTHQQIYGWRYAINSIEKVDFPAHHLTTSFRLNSDIAKLAEEILARKRHLIKYTPIKIIGKNTSEKTKTKAVIARTNLGLLQLAIRYAKKEKIYFEGNIKSYTYASGGTSLYDALNLYLGKYNKIKNSLLRSMPSFSALEDYTEKTNDFELGLMVKLIQTYKGKLPDIIEAIKTKQVADEDKYNAEVIFSTVHKCKGMEYDSVQLAEDFLSEDLLKSNATKYPTDKLIEEINLLYVAVTRAKNTLHIPFIYKPDKWPDSRSIKTINTPKESPSKNINYSIEEFMWKGDILKEPSIKIYSKLKDEIQRVASILSPTVKIKPILNNYSKLYGFDIGDNVEHNKFGIGKVLTIEGEFPNTTTTVMFNGIFKKKKLLLKMAKLKKV